jgi:hypothetical protein
LKFEYLREFEPEFENVLGYELGAHMGLIHENNQGPKISCYCTFKALKMKRNIESKHVKGWPRAPAWVLEWGTFLPAVHGGVVFLSTPRVVMIFHGYLQIRVATSCHSCTQ